ncbi:MAG: VTC domain-containing protein, partial [Raoultibacter sp.]
SYEEACQRFPLADELAGEQSLSLRSIQIAREIDFFREHYDRLTASMLVVCERSAFGDPDGGELRITFDECIGAHPYAESLTEVDACVPLTADGEVIMEVKNAGPLPFWLVDCLSGTHAYPQTFSKYGTAYLNLIAPEEIAAVSVNPRGRHARVTERSKTCA